MIPINKNLNSNKSASKADETKWMIDQIKNSMKRIINQNTLLQQGCLISFRASNGPSNESVKGGLQRTSGPDGLEHQLGRNDDRSSELEK